MKTGSLTSEMEPTEHQTWLRIRLSVAAYAYEFESDPIMPDAQFYSLCLEINPSVLTGNKVMDEFFKTQFDPSTGQWIHRHPELQGIRRTYEKYYKKSKEY